MEISIPLFVYIGLPVIGALIGFAVAWGAYGQKIKNNRKDIEELKEHYNIIDTKLDDICTTVARIEGRLNGEIFKRR